MSKSCSDSNASYAVDYEHIGALFVKEVTDWNQLCAAINSALADPFLPPLYRLEYNVILAYYADDAERYIQAAKDGIDAVFRLLQAEGRSEEQIEQHLVSLQQIIDAAESDLAEVSDEDASAKITTATAARTRAEGLSDGSVVLGEHQRMPGQAESEAYK